MQVSRLRQMSSSVSTMLSLTVMLLASHPAAESRPGPQKASCSNDAGLKLPSGFCATVFADEIGHARHLAVAPSGVVYVNTWSGEYYGNKPSHPGGFLVALRDKSGSGSADDIERFGESPQNGGKGGTGIGIYKGWLYAEIDDRIVRYQLPKNGIAPEGTAETIVSGLPLGGDHPMHPFIIDANGSMYVDVSQRDQFMPAPKSSAEGARHRSVHRA